ncbi:Testis-expressed sequence 2 protein [Liparis tanakae]|uniref:Testis-expressed sequence 2 protein n=1 Tax=Liparis tanakae TaxID=230148 RepID=A0A4Z2HMC6_9TELE|nr:Testis-expressed sequence 2 protein [Liparis tanakae]
MEESELIFKLDGHDEGPTVAFSKAKQHKRKSQPDLSLGMDLDLSRSHRSQPPFLSHSPSSPGSLADLSASSADLLLTTNLVKSSSSDLEPGEESSSLHGKPLLSLVKSLSTEISRRVEPEVNLSKSDSKLHLHPWKQLTHPKISEARSVADELNENDDWVSPPSAGGVPPAEPRGSSLIAELEDTRRKFSEAMQDPLSMLSKIMGDESSGSPKQGRASGGGDSPSSQGSCGRDGGGEDADVKCRRRAEERHSGDSQLEIRTYGDVIQVVELQRGSRGTTRRTHSQSGGPVPSSSLPLHWLLPVGLLAYGFFVLPLPPYVTGLSVGVACGFMLGLAVVFMFAPRHSSARSNKGLGRSRSLNMEPPDGQLTVPEILEGWMNETHSYDPETFHPSITHSVYVTLEGSQLRLAYPRTNIPRWASFDETSHEAVFLRSRSYTLANSKVSLLPPGLARKRIWNKKYPVCVTLADGEVGEESVIEGKEEEERAEKHPAPDHQLPVTLYLFGRTGREKEEWFQHFLSASRAGAQSGVSREENAEAPCAGDAAREGTEEPHDLPGALKTRMLLEYSTYMTHLIGPQSCNPAPSPCHSDKGSPTAHKKTHNEEHGCGGQAGDEPSAGSVAEGCSAEGQPTWVNSLVGRIFWDFLQEKYWTDQVAHKIQKKLSKIKVRVDKDGLWLELEVMYTGCLQMSLETKMNLCKLGKDVEDEAHSVLETQQVGHTGGSTSRKILRFVDKIAKSKYFQKATENEYIRKKIAEVSNMPLMLSVEVLELSGTLAINIPPPPTDRIWYSFRVPPRLDLHVRPTLGEREVTFTHVTEWIERKLQCEFQSSMESQDYLSE